MTTRKLVDFFPPQLDKKYLLRLYVTGATARSRRAIVNINSICQQHLASTTSK